MADPVDEALDYELKKRQKQRDTFVPSMAKSDLESDHPNSQGSIWEDFKEMIGLGKKKKAEPKKKPEGAAAQAEALKAQ